LLESVREQLAIRANYEWLKAERQAREAARVAAFDTRRLGRTESS
jgi:hypothetical protein